MSSQTVYAHYIRLCSTFTDTQGHMDTFKQYASHCETVTEFGVREGISTWSFLAGMPKKLTSYDLERTVAVDAIEHAATDSGTVFTFILGNSLEVDIEPTDLLMIDTKHTYKQLREELFRHAAKVKKWIIMHDTTTFANVDEPIEKGWGQGLWCAIEEFLVIHPEWTVKERFTHFHGLTVLERKPT
jgi:hypothetical protein